MTTHNAIAVIGNVRSVGLGSVGELEVDVARFTPAVAEYVFNYGLKQMLNDAHASVKASDPEGKRALAEKKLASLYAGETAQPRGSSDPVKKELIRIATDYAKGKIKAAGRKWADFTDEQKETILANAIAKNPAFEVQARENVAKTREAVASAEPVDLSDLGID